MDLPLKGITVLEFSQFLSGPVAGLRLSDFGARVIKVERPEKGESGRHLAIENLWVENDSLLFHTINRGKESVEINLKSPEGLETVMQLISKVDILTHNFRPGVMKSLGIDYDKVREVNPEIIYTEISGYGKKGPWSHKPGQDLLAQAVSGLTYTTGNKDSDPVPFGLGIGDYLCGNQAVQAIIGALIRRRQTGKGAFIELSLLESLIDFQFEFFTTYFRTGIQPSRGGVNNAHSLLGAPYGLYKTSDGFIAVAMTPLNKLIEAFRLPELNKFTQKDVFNKRDEINLALSRSFVKDTTGEWLAKAEKYDLWAMPVLNWKQLRQTSAYRSLNFEQEISAGGRTITVSRCPVSYNGNYFLPGEAAPELGKQNTIILKELIG